MKQKEAGDECLLCGEICIKCNICNLVHCPNDYDKILCNQKTKK